ncbi:MAG: Spy/CpxP family protein refolding chaperone [Telluria sp.]|nr:Spy/CpxP family protein refolding chaperone [Telluria sp.]
MKHAHKHLIAAALLALGFAAGAQAPAQATATPGSPAASAAGPQGHHMGRHHGRMDPARMQQRMERRQAQLKQKLQITAAQEGAWSAYTAAMKPPANFQRIDRAELAKLTTPERIDRMRALRTARAAEMDKRADATKSFYSALTAEQKKVFDGETFRGGRGGHHRGHHGDHRV